MSNTGTKESFLKRKNVEISFKRYGIDAMGAMALGLFASLLIGTIFQTIAENVGTAGLMSTLSGLSGDDLSVQVASLDGVVGYYTESEPTPQP